MRYKRDARTGAAILCDSEAVSAYLSKKTQQEQIQALQRQINTLQEQVLELQQHLLKDKQSE